MSRRHDLLCSERGLGLARVRRYPLVLLLVLSTSSCSLLESGRRKTAPTASAAEQPAPAPAQTATSQPAPSSAPPQQTVAEVCSALRNSIHVGCQISVQDGKIVMLTHFESRADWSRYFQVVTGDLGNPFCEAAKLAKQQAAIRAELHGVGYQELDCYTHQWTPLAAFRPPTPEQLCRALETDAQGDIKCASKYANGMYSMTLTFRDEAREVQLRDELNKQMLAPFCTVSNERGSPALFTELFTGSSRARTYSCEARRWGDWYALRRPPAPTRPSQPQSGQQSGPSANSL